MKGMNRRLRPGSVRGDMPHSMWCKPGAKRFARKRIHKAERHLSIDPDGIVPLNIIVKGETNIVAPTKRGRATKVQIAPNVFDIVYVES